MGYKSDLKLGDIICSTSCGEFEVIKRDAPNKATVRFIKTGYEVETFIESVKSGNIKDPYFPQVLGIGYLGIGEFISKVGSSSNGFNSLPEYNAWINMLQRCYYDKYETRVIGCIAYNSVTVCDEWHNFQVFAEWYTKKRKPLDDAALIKPSLDKDILSVTKQAIIYSPYTCCVIPKEINAMLIGRNRKQISELPIGVTKTRQGYRVSATSVNSIAISNKFETIDECVNWRNSIDQERFRIMADKYKHVLESRVYDKLCNWDKF